MGPLTETLSPEAKQAAALDRYSAFRIVLSINGLDFTSQSVPRSRIENVLRNQPANLRAIEGLIPNSFIPEDWEIVSL
jgi:hypothetical protein